jgi:hypothetical protein
MFCGGIYLKNQAFIKKVKAAHCRLKDMAVFHWKVRRGLKYDENLFIYQYFVI